MANVKHSPKQNTCGILFATQQKCNAGIDPKCHWYHFLLCCQRLEQTKPQWSRVSLSSFLTFLNVAHNSVAQSPDGQ